MRRRKREPHPSHKCMTACVKRGWEALGDFGGSECREAVHEGCLRYCARLKKANKAPKSERWRYSV